MPKCDQHARLPRAGFDSDVLEHGIIAFASYVPRSYIVLTVPKKLTRTGNSLALVLEKPILEAAGIDDETPLEVSTDGDVIIVSPVRSKRRTAKLKKILAELHREHAGAFRRLAE